jgi:hypothetical protein
MNNKLLEKIKVMIGMLRVKVKKKEEKKVKKLKKK